MTKQYGSLSASFDTFSLEEIEELMTICSQQALNEIRDKLGKSGLEVDDGIFCGLAQDYAGRFARSIAEERGIDQETVQPIKIQGPSI
ncbi:MAG: hypothetical protein GC192_21285 [Bacteroidetes bacterium]|nr:hypothetical protein [Bacteroidota bacterium]